MNLFLRIEIGLKFRMSVTIYFFWEPLILTFLYFCLKLKLTKLMILVFIFILGMFSVCSVNDCVRNSNRCCFKCVNVTFCEDHIDHSTFHYRRCQYDRCRNKISTSDSIVDVDGLEFISKYTLCMNLSCFGRKFFQ